MKKEKKIIINAKEVEFIGDTISYEQILEIIKGRSGALYTVTFHFHKSAFGVGGSLTPQQSTKVYAGMIINAVITGKA